MKSMVSSLGGSLVLALAFGTSASAEPTLVNGSFEAGPPVNADGYARGQAPVGWSSVPGQEAPDIIHNSYAQGGPPYKKLLSAQSGEHFVDMNGAFPAGAFYQDLSGLMGGASVVLTYFVGQWAQNSSGDLYAALIDPQTSVVLNAQTHSIAFNNTVTQAAWSEHSLAASIPETGNLRVYFGANAYESARAAPGLDNVSLSFAPAPAPLAAGAPLMLAGCAVYAVAQPPP